MNTIVEIQDEYNPIKVWVVKKTKCSHFYVNQKINGKLFYDRFSRMRKKSLKQIMNGFSEIHKLEISRKEIGNEEKG